MMYIESMLRINIYIPEDLNKMLDVVAQTKRKPKAEVIREALKVGMRVIKPASHSAQALITLAKLAKEIPTKGNVPKDFVKNLDHYTWGGKKRE